MPSIKAHKHEWRRYKAARIEGELRLILYKCRCGFWKIEDHTGGAVTESVYRRLRDRRLDVFVPRGEMFEPTKKVRAVEEEAFDDDGSLS